MNKGVKGIDFTVFNTQKSTVIALYFCFLLVSCQNILTENWWHLRKLVLWVSDGGRVSQNALQQPAGAVAQSQGPACCQSSQAQVHTAKVSLI